MSTGTTACSSPPDNERRAVAHGHAFGLRCVEQRTVGDADDIGRNEFFFGVAEGSGRSCFHRVVDCVFIYVAFANRNELGKRTGGNGNALRATVEHAVEFGNYKPDRLCSARRVGNDVRRSRARTAQIALQPFVCIIDRTNRSGRSKERD